MKTQEVFTLGELMDMEFPKLVTIDKDGDIVLHGPYRYEIEANRCITYRDILSWVLHLSHKDWFTNEMSVQFINCTLQINRMKL